MDPPPRKSKAEIVPSFDIGSHVFAPTASKDSKMAGVIRFVGETHFAEGEWVGVELEEPEGKNAGIVQGIRYFGCQANHGIFVRKSALTSAQDETMSPKKLVTPKSSGKKIGAGARAAAKAGGSAPSSPLQGGGSEDHSPKAAAAVGSPPPKVGTPQQSASRKQAGGAAASAQSAGAVRHSKSREAGRSRASNKITPDRNYNIDSYSDYEGDGSPEIAPKRHSIEDLENKDWSALGPGGAEPNAKARATAGGSASRQQHPKTKKGTAFEGDTRAKHEADPVAERSRAMAQRKSTAQLQLASAVEDHDPMEIREALREARDAGVDLKEIETAEHVLSFEEQDSDEEFDLMERMDELSRQLKAVEARFEQEVAGRTRSGSGASWLDDRTLQLEERVLHRLEERMEQVVERAVKRATQEVLGAASEVNRLRGGAPGATPLAEDLRQPDIQAAARQSVSQALEDARVRADEHIRAEARAATTFALNGASARIKEMVNEEEEKAKLLEAAFRRRQHAREGGVTAVDEAQAASEQEQALRIQAIYRGKQVREQVARQREEAEALKIQAASRSGAREDTIESDLKPPEQRADDGSSGFHPAPRGQVQR